MRYCAVIAALALCLGVVPAQLLAANTWCATNHADSVFCEDWDRYCAEPPPEPTEACPAGSERGEIPINRPWQTGMAGCSGLTLEDFWITSVPFSGRTLSDGDIGNSRIILGAFIRTKFGQAYTRMVGTDLAPMTLEFVLDGPTQDGKMAAANTYMELAANVDQPLTDYILSDRCDTCGDPYAKMYPMICRQAPAPKNLAGVTCPPIATAAILPSLACGALAYLDSKPCHCGETVDHFPRNTQLNFFDGKRWWTLNSTLVPAIFPGSGKFQLYARKTQNTTWQEPGPNHVKLTIVTASVKIELDARNGNTGEMEHSECTIPRQYLGSFNLLNMGYAQPCRLKNNGTWECAAVRQCVLGAPGAGTNTYDNIAVGGGMGYDDPGACCITKDQATPVTIECRQANGEMDCNDTHGGQFKGPGTVCGAVPCCPAFLPDQDMDKDVDLEDFGWFQTCLSSAKFADPPTVQCKCANLDGDTDVDSDDFVIFARCLSGPGVPADTNCVN